MDLRNCLGMMASVSTFSRSIGATRPLCTVNFCMVIGSWPGRIAVRRRMGVAPRRRGHGGADEVGAPARALPAFEIAVAGRGAALARLQAVGVHRQAHRAARLAPL